VITQKLIGPGNIFFLLLLLLTGSACTESGFPLGGNKYAPDIASDRLKLLVGEEGIYRLTAGDLSASGVDIDGDEGLSYDNLSLSSGQVEIPFLIKDKTLIFYGQPSNDRYYRERPYMLRIGIPGQAMGIKDIQPAGEPLLDHVRQTVRLEEDQNYVPESREGESDVWFWSRISQQDKFTTDFSLPFPSGGASTLRFNVWGFSQNPDLENDHDFEILVNDTAAGTAVFDGRTHHTAEMLLPPAALHSGVNTITLDNSRKGASILDIIQLNWLELDYPSLPTAVDDRLDFTSGSGKVVLNGFSGSPLVLDVSDPIQPLLLEGGKYEKDQLQMALTGGQRIAAVGPRGFLKPGLETVKKSNWLDRSHQADLIIITTADLAPALVPLISAREAEGVSVAVVPVSEIYDEIADGAPSPESIRDFVAYAYHNWQAPQPRYLLLVGDATSDYLGRLGDPPKNIVPSLLVPVQISGETVSDSRLADVDDDQRPELAVGRWPVQTKQEAADLVKRTLAYEENPAVGQAIFATDGSEGSFSQMASHIIDQAELRRDDVIQTENPTAEEIGDLWQASPWLATYLGHGSIDRWGKEDIFSLQELDKLRGESAPIVLQLTCLTGLFSDPQQVSLAEGMLLHNNGPVLVIAASSLTFSYHQEPFAVEFLRQLQASDVERIGDAFFNAKEVLDIENSEGYREISDTFALFGDPSAKISRP
jgi:hypothetical protein